MVKLEQLRNTLNNAIENETKLKIIRLQGIFNCILLEKKKVGNQIEEIKVKILKNNSDDYPEDFELNISLSDGGIIEVQVLS
ncbi:hypothetical protein [Dokdonia sp.]|uniref:hypothetical protein n=1 Tax=Dokdonia sp. TaxID=2024995 RepID=UPI0032664074